MSVKVPITIAYGDGIGPEIMKATLDIIQAAGANIELETIEIGESIYKKGFSTGIEPVSWDSLRRTKVFLKAPITTPQGGGFKSLNVTIRKTLGLYANVRPCVAYHPFVETKHPGMDVVIVRENEEDLYAGIEYRQTDQMTQALKIISVPGSEKIIRYAFEYARQNNRKKVTCFTKDNIMKISDGLLHKLFDVIAKEYPDIVPEHWIVDIGAAKLADSPETFDVVVMPNLYGDILSDVAAQIAGSVGLAGSANIGDHIAMFEAIHGSAPRRAGQNLANPSGLLLGAVMMLVHIGQPEVAGRVHNAWLRTIEEGVHTYDIFAEGVSKEKVGTKEFAKAVIQRMGKEPEKLKVVEYKVMESKPRESTTFMQAKTKEIVGVDIFVDKVESNPNKLADVFNALNVTGLKLEIITNRGVKVWPEGQPETYLSNHWRCRFKATSSTGTSSYNEIVTLLQKAGEAGIDVTGTETLYNYDGVLGYSLGAGE